MCLCTRGCCVCTAWPQREPQTQGRRNHPIRFSSPVPPPHRHTSVPTESGVPVPDQPNENRPPRGLRESHVDFFSLKNEICSPPNVQRSDTLCFQCCCFLAKKETVPRVLHDTGCPRGESPPRPLGLGAPGEEDRTVSESDQSRLGAGKAPHICSQQLHRKRSGAPPETPRAPAAFAWGGFESAFALRAHM